MVGEVKSIQLPASMDNNFGKCNSIFANQIGEFLERKDSDNLGEF